MGKKENPVNPDVRPLTLNLSDNKFIDPVLEEGLLKLGIDCDPANKVPSRLTRYVEEIELFNSAYGLVKVMDRRELILKHILDSLAPLKTIRGFSKEPRLIADVGSGAGLPGIPLAICLPDTEFTLIERMGRRAGFLRNTIAALGLPNVRLAEAEIEKLSLSPEERFDLVVFRAFKPLDPVILKHLSKILVPGGIIAAYKGRKKSIEEEMGKIDLLRAKISLDIIRLEVPFLEEERHLLVIRHE